jgi:hypothetical protein
MMEKLEGNPATDTDSKPETPWQDISTTPLLNDSQLFGMIEARYGLLDELRRLGVLNQHQISSIRIKLDQNEFNGLQLTVV